MFCLSSQTAARPRWFPASCHAPPPPSYSASQLNHLRPDRGQHLHTHWLQTMFVSSTMSPWLRQAVNMPCSLDFDIFIYDRFFLQTILLYFLVFRQFGIRPFWYQEVLVLDSFGFRLSQLLIVLVSDNHDSKKFLFQIIIVLDSFDFRLSWFQAVFVSGYVGFRQFWFQIIMVPDSFGFK